MSKGFTFLTEMKPQQKKADEKLKGLKVGALFMDMGTGKTRAALQLINNRYVCDKIKQVLWLCPCSVRQDMELNILDHIDDMNIIKIYGIESLSQSDRLYMKLLYLVSVTRTYLVVDESSLVKNFFALCTQRITAIAVLCPYRLLLNGTPVGKDESDLFAQWYILDKRILGYNSFYSFAANHIEYDDYGHPRRCLNVDYLAEKIEPYTYTCKKEDCLDLPHKNYRIKSFTLTFEQEMHYNQIKEIMLDDVNEFDSTTIYRLFTALQLICSGRRIISLKPRLKSVPFFISPYENPRIKALIEFMKNITGDEKMIIWCKFRHEIEDVKTVLGNIDGPDNVCEFHGGLSFKRRQEQLRNFRNNAKRLIANKVCGGFGLNLQCSHLAAYYSNDFNWITRAQSEDRIHRMGQEHEVYLYDFCAGSKVDMRILQNLNKKGVLADEFKKELKKGKNLSRWIDGLDD